MAISGYKVTLEEVRDILKKAHGENSPDIIAVDLDAYLSSDGYYEFESWEEYKKICGEFFSLEETFS